MTVKTFDYLKSEVAKREKLVKDYLLNERPITLGHRHLNDAVYSYIKAGGKSLRPAVLMFSAGVVGGDEAPALPVAAAVELYHTFTLVHDDIIDRDEMRRGVPTVHVDFANRARQDFGFDEATASHYGLSLAILAGDIQQGWAASLVTELYRTYGKSAALALNLVDELFRAVMGTLVNGETLDIVLAETPIDRVTEDQVLSMLWQKTGVLYDFAGRAGAAIGLNEPDLKHKTVESVATFCGKVGVAFQLQDDVLGVVGDSAKMGKAVGNDIREGKRTLVLLGSLPRMTEAQRKFAFSVLGNSDASDSDVMEVADLLQSSGGVDYARSIARGYVDEGLAHLHTLPESETRALLEEWADYLIYREA